MARRKTQSTSTAAGLPSPAVQATNSAAAREDGNGKPEAAAGTQAAQQAETSPATSVEKLHASTMAEQPQVAGQAGTPLKVTLKRRLEREGRWKEIEPLRDAMMREARQKGMSKEEAQTWAYTELERLYPPLPPPPPAAQQAAPEAAPDTSSETASEPQTPQINTQAESQETGNVSQAGEATDAAEQQVQPPAEAPARPRDGIGQIPADWPELPPNASLSAEIAWVQAERLRIVEERPNGSTVVRLERARTPAPSWSALSWLETSIRSYAKFVEVAAKASGAGQDEQEQVRAERMAIDDVRALLGEMLQ